MESEWDAACREFEEETGFTKYTRRSDVRPMYEDFRGLNKKRYTYTYFLVHGNCETEQLKIPKDNQAEVGEIRWMKFNQAMKAIRYNNKQKKALLFNINEFLCKIGE